MIKLFKNTISFDIDGVLNDYPYCFYKFIEFKVGKQYSSKQEIIEDLGADGYSYLKHLYRTEEYKYSLNIDEGVKKNLNLINQEFKLIFLTTRPFEDYPAMHQRTWQWLAKNDINHSGIFKKNTTELLKNNVIIHVDDQVQHVLPLLSNTNTMFLIYGGNIETKRIKSCPKFTNLYEKILSLT
jgi:hypothetical protein